MRQPFSWARFDSRPCCIDWTHPYHSWRCSDALHMLFCVRMQSDSLNVFRRVFFGDILRTRGTRVTMQDMCVEKPRHPVQDHVMAAWRGQEAVGVVFHQPRGCIRIVNLVCLEMMSFAFLHTLSGWLLRPLFVSVNISAVGAVCFRSREAVFFAACV